MRVLLLALLAGFVPGAGSAQNLPSSPPQRTTPDFLFGRPDTSIGLRGTWVIARGGSDWYDFVTQHLTLEPEDFNAPAIGVDVGVAVTPRLEIVGALDYGHTRTDSEYRDFVDNLRRPIEQQTLLRELNLSAGLKIALTERGREIGQFAWVPRAVVPYVGAGGGMMWFEMRQSGDFVDFVDSSVFTDRFESRGWTPSGHLFGGVDIRIVRRLYLTLDVRYLWAAGDLGPDWIDFDPIDLTGMRLSAGFNVVF